MKQVNPLNAPVVWLIVLFVFSVQTSADSAPGIEPENAKQPATAQAVKREGISAPDVIVADETKPWQLPLLTVLATNYGQTHLFVAGTSRPGKVQASSNVLASIMPRRVLTLTGMDLPVADSAKLERIPAQTPQLLSEYLASTYWSDPEHIVIVKRDDPELAVFGAVYAHYMECPLLYIDTPASLTRLVANYPQAKRHVFLTRSGEFAGHRVLGKTHLKRRIVDKMKRKKGGIKNIIVAHPPNSEGDANAAWLAGYASIRRNAPILFVKTTKATVAEKAVKKFMETYSLNPRSITLLASEDEIGNVTAVIENSRGSNWEGLLLKDDFFAVETEPFCMPYEKDMISWAVGRIPFPDAVATSQFLCHIYAREWVTTRANKHVVMVANPEQETGEFPLAETISRLTAKEIGNFRYSLDEFYGVPTNHDSINKAIKNAHLVIYEGHIEDQRFLDDPSFFLLDNTTPAEHKPLIPHSLPTDLFDGMFVTTPGESLFSLPNHPILILQSCNSLQKETVAHFSQLGGSAVIGSSTKIHSASGSAFMHCFLIQALYGGKTIGEALTDARNYFLCMQALKDVRGHKEQSKSLRVALSFALWGDPESRLLSAKNRKPSRAPINIGWENGDVIIRVPDRGLPKVNTTHYKASMFPGSQAAGLVKRSKKKPENPLRIVPLYFFAIEKPKDIDLPSRGVLSVKGDSTRAVYRVDVISNKLFVVYFPQKEVAGGIIRLKFVK